MPARPSATTRAQRSSASPHSARGGFHGFCQRGQHGTQASAAPAPTSARPPSRATRVRSVPGGGHGAPAARAHARLAGAAQRRRAARACAQCTAVGVVGSLRVPTPAWQAPGCCAAAAAAAGSSHSCTTPGTVRSKTCCCHQRNTKSSQYDRVIAARAGHPAALVIRCKATGHPILVRTITAGSTGAS